MSGQATSGRRPFKDLTAGFSADRQARVATRVTELKGDMALADLRHAGDQAKARRRSWLEIWQRADLKWHRYREPASSRTSLGLMR